MKKYFLLAAFMLGAAPAFAQPIGVILPVFAVSANTSFFGHQFEGSFRPFFGVGVQLEFMVGGRFYFYGALHGDYNFSLNPALDSNSLQFAFAIGMGYIIKNNVDVKGFSIAINFAPLGIGLDIRDVGTLRQNSTALYRFFVNVPFRFHIQRARTFQLAPYIVLGAHTRGAVYNILFNTGLTFGITF